MGIRNTAKAMIIRDGSILLNRCFDPDHGEYYTLPGGGQHQYETIGQALIRECLEETGHKVRIVRFAAFCEEICMDEEVRRIYPDYSHKCHHIFICEIEHENQAVPTELDDMQLDSEWSSLERLDQLKILPELLSNNIKELLKQDGAIFLGSEYIAKNHGRRRSVPAYYHYPQQQP